MYAMYVGVVRTWAQETVHTGEPSADYRAAWRDANEWRLAHYPNGSIALEKSSS